MRRVLVVLRGPLDDDNLRACCETIAAEEGTVAVCRVTGVLASSLLETLDELRATTRLLRSRLGDRAEAIAIFVASGADGDRVEDWAREWGATMVIP